MHNIIQMETSAKLYSLPFGNVKTYLFVLLFVAGNIALPQLCHLVPAGGPTLLPIYFFTLIAAYKYGFKVGLLTALLSPVINHLLFAMPAAAVYNPQIQISAESETKRSIFREKDKTKRSKKESAQHSKSRNKSFVMTSVSAL